MGIKSVLVVEDEYFAADEMAEAVRVAGHIVVGPVGRVREALALIESTKIDCAILDLHLDEGLSLEIGSALSASNIPFAIASGYDGEILGGVFESSLYFIKPVEPDQVVRSVLAA